MNGGANSSSAPALTALNIFNAIKPEKCIALVNALIFTALVIIKNINGAQTLTHGRTVCTTNFFPFEHTMQTY